MKLLIAVVQAYDADKLLRAVTAANLRATRINSVGGFLRMANATILMAMDEERIPEAVQLIRENCQRRVEVKLDAETAEYSDWYAAGFHEVAIGGAVVFGIPIEMYVQITPGEILKHKKAPVP